MKSRAAVAGLCLVGVLALAVAVQGSVMLYDPFIIGQRPDTPGYYNEGELLRGASNSITHNSWVGSVSPWSGEGNWDPAHSYQHGQSWAPQAAGLTYSKGGYDLVTQGGSLDNRFRTETTTNSTWRRFSEAPITSGTIYFSFLAEWDAWNGGWQAFGLGSGLTTTGAIDQALLFVTAADGKVRQAFYPNSTGDHTTPVASRFQLIAGETYFFVGRVDVNEKFTVWINPALGIAEGDLTASDYDGLLVSYAPEKYTSGIHQGFVFAPRNSAEAHKVAFDEVRVGTTWESVTPIPEPATLLFLATGLTGVWGLKRRRQN